MTNGLFTINTISSIATGSSRKELFGFSAD